MKPLSLLGALGLALTLPILPGPAQGDEATTSRTPQKRGARAYNRSLRRWTEELQLYARFETKILMRAVFKSDAFRDAYVHEYARRYVLPSEEYALMRQREMDDGARFHEILFAVWAADSKGGHFIGDDAPWHIRLVASDDRTVAPLVLTRIKRPSTELLTLYPFITPHDRIFVAKFPVLGGDGTPLVTTENEALRLRVTGVLARGEMSWPLTGDEKR